MRDEIVQPDVVIECIRPETWQQVCARQHCTKGITDGLMRPFSGTILMRGVWAGQFDSVAEVGESAVDLTTLSELSPSIHTNVAVRATGGVVREPIVYPVDGWSLRGESATVEPTTEVIGDEGITGFTI